MSGIQDYFPPRGTKYQWGSKALHHSPWRCAIWDEVFPAFIIALVDQEGPGKFVWTLEIRDWKYKVKRIKGRARSGLKACLAAEKAADEEKKLLWLPWMEHAVKAGWRPTT